MTKLAVTPVGSDPQLPVIQEPDAISLLLGLGWSGLLIGALLIVPLEWTAERFTTGWSSLLAYPRLYAAWGLWALSLKELQRQATRPPSRA